MGRPQEIKAGEFSPLFEGKTRLPFATLQKLGFLLIEAQAKLLEPLWQDSHESADIVLELKQCNAIVRIPNQSAVAPAVLAHSGGKPLIQHKVQEHIRNDGGDYRALRAAQFILHDATWGLDSGFEHSRNQLKESSIPNPLG